MLLYLVEIPAGWDMTLPFSGSFGASTCTSLFISTTIRAWQKRRLKDFTEVPTGKDLVGWMHGAALGIYIIIPKLGCLQKHMDT